MIVVTSDCSGASGNGDHNNKTESSKHRVTSDFMDDADDRIGDCVDNRLIPQFGNKKKLRDHIETKKKNGRPTRRSH